VTSQQPAPAAGVETIAGPTVVAVVVTYNREKLLHEALTAVLGQDRLPDHVIVVNNASTDGTTDLVRTTFASVRLVELARNTGGAGGFALGLERALQLGADLVWLLDDDAVPEPGALGALLYARTRYRGRAVPAAIASRVVWLDGREHRMNIPRRRRGASHAEHAAARAVGCTPIRTASFVSLLIDADAARATKPPLADYFLWNDDFEYTARLLRDRLGLLCPASLVVHKTASFYNSGSDPGRRFFYDVRNMIWMLGRSRGLSPLERAFFTVVAARRFVRTIYRSRHRRVLVAGLARGAFAAVRAGPRPTAQVLSDVRPSGGDHS